MIRNIAMSLVVVATFGCEKDTPESPPSSAQSQSAPATEPSGDTRVVQKLSAEDNPKRGHHSAPDSPADGGEPSIEYSVEEESPSAPLQPMIPTSQLVERDSLVYRQEDGKAFDGRTVLYSGIEGFWIQEYLAGKKTCSGFSDEAQEPPEELFPADPLYLAAVRGYVARYGPGHNEYFFYSKYGGESDLPMLLCSLKSFGESKGPFICSRAHCVDALRSITGATPGHNYSDWAKWWKAKYKRDPPHWEPEKHSALLLRHGQGTVSH